MSKAVRPVPSRLPPQPRELCERGLCVTHPHPEWWVSGRPAECEAAAAVCGYCPVLASCRRWALSLPDSDRAVYAGMTPRERRQARREPVPAPSAGDAIPGAA